ncbi:MAG: IS630 family transposase, partial [Gammaproteobacteria bacterium]|nr:IS630 family transposase [Gammaproteobacteria bacterium]
KHQKIPHHKIAAIAGVCENTMCQYFSDYLRGGINLITSINFYKPQSKLKSFDTKIKEHFKRNPPTSIAKACAEIKQLTNVSIKNTQMRKYLKYLGMKFRKVSSVPAKADVEAQRRFHDEKLQPKLEEAKDGKQDVYFVDAAHFVLGAFLGYLWCFTRVFVRTPCGRQRFNVLGALNAITKQLVTITNDTYITSTQVCELLRTLAKNASRPITIVLDNAPYQRCQMVMQLAQELGIELLFLPPYAPNLNLIERLWKLVKKECLYSVYYENFSHFRGAIQVFLTNMEKTHRKQLNSLFTLNFQTFTEEQLKFAA